MENAKKSDRQESSPFEGLQKSLVLHESQIFSEAPLNPKNCCRVLTKILYLLCQGEKFTSDEATGVFFGTTKLFQSHNVALRRMVYLVIKELARGQDNVFVVINCLSKDMTSNNDMFRANAIRVFAKVIDASMLGTMERFLKQAIVDRNPTVASASLIAGQQLFRIAPDAIKRWQNEIQEALNSKSNMVQYHAFALLCMVKQNDRLAITKIVVSLTVRPPRSVLLHCLLIRYVVKILRVEHDQALLDFLLAALRNSSSPVAFEAIRGVCSLPSIAAHHIQSAISSVQYYLGSSLAAERFAAVRILASTVSLYPTYIVPCSTDLEMLLQDPNRSIATLAVTTLLKTGVESSIERLMKSISTFMAEISDELRIVLVDAIRSLCLKFPQKHVALMAFLSSILREEGGLDYKSRIVMTILTLMQEIDDAKESGLEHLCEFIEDCEFPTLAVKILYVLSEEGPKTKNPGRYIRFIYNRIILEVPSIRAAAVQSLARFAAACPALSPSCVALLKRGLRDNDDEVRDRATYYLALLKEPNQCSNQLLTKRPVINWLALERSLLLYISDPSKHQRPFSMNDVSSVETPVAPQLDVREPTHNAFDFSSQPAAASEANAINPFIGLINSIPEFASLGPLFKSTTPIELTEAEAEYVTSYVKHIFSNHVLLQFNITSFMEGQVLVNVSVDLETDDEWVEEMSVPAPILEHEVGGVVWICLSRPEGQYISPSIPGTLKFSVRDANADADEAGYDDEYELEELSISAHDFVKHADQPVSLGEFRQLWDGSSTTGEAIVKLDLDVPTLQEAVNRLRDQLPFLVVDNATFVEPDANTHSLNMYGQALGSSELILVRAGFMKPKGQTGVVAKVAVRCQSSEWPQLVTQIIR